jgi:hypothetical protein
MDAEYPSIGLGYTRAMDRDRLATISGSRTRIYKGNEQYLSLAGYADSVTQAPSRIYKGTGQYPSLGYTVQGQWTISESWTRIYKGNGQLEYPSLLP